MGRHHKNENTFKFRTFSERLTDVQIDVTRRTTRLADVPQDADTFFGEALQKWSDLNRTEHFVKFRAEIAEQVQSLAQLIHHKDSIITALQTHLKVEGSLAAPALLDIVVQLARDLQQDFYPHFPGFFEILVSFILKPKQDVDLLESAFTTLSFLFKIMWREMVQDMDNVLEIYSPLFTLQRRHHIKRFAAESIAFVIRKVKDRDRLFGQIFERVEKNEKEIEGYGLILFEMMKGVKNQLHSCTDIVLPNLLSKLLSESVLKTLDVAFKALLRHADMTHIQTVWKGLLDFVDGILKPKTKRTDEVAMETLARVFKLIRLMVEFNRGKTLKECERLTQQLVSIIQLPFHEECHPSLLDVVVALLQNSPLQIREVHQIVKEIFKSDLELGVILDFVRRVFAVSCFEQSVLLPFMTYCHQAVQKRGLEKEILKILTELICQKCPMPDTAEQDQKLYILDFSAMLRGKKNVKWLGDELMDIMKNFKGAGLPELWCALVCLPNVRPVPQNCETVLGQVLQKLLAMKSGNCGRSLVLCQCMTSLDHVSDHQPHLTLDLETMIKFVGENHDDVNVLRMMDLYTTRLASSKDNGQLDDVTGTAIMTSLKPNLTSCYSLIRLLTVRILSQFEFELPVLDDPNFEQMSVFKICLEAEKVPLSVQDYREKQLHLSKLEYGHVQRQLPANEEAQDVPLRFLLGSMYNNFSLLWLPIRGMIETHAQGMARDEFWAIYAEHLEFLAGVNENPSTNRKAEFETEQDNVLGDLFKAVFLEQSKHPDQPDYGIVRFHLWKSMQQFAPLCETKSKTLCPLLFRFLEKEYYTSDLNAAVTQDLRKVDVAMTTEDDDDEENVEEKEGKAGKKTGKKRTPLTKSLIAHLEIFSKFKSPKSMTMESQLLDLYYRLLSHRYQNIQKVALNCLFTYKYKFLVPYRENLDRLLDDAHFKDEIVLFGLSEENTVIESEHRDMLMPILMRILYGRMISKTGKETTGKQNASLRKTLVLRFLGGCRQEELRVFMDLVFGCFKDYYSENLAKKVEKVLSEIDVSSVLPIRQQQSALHTMDVVFTNLGNSIDTYLSELFHIVTCVTSVSIRLLDERQNLVPQSVNSLKTLRSLGMTRISQFFTSFENYEFSDSELDGLFSGVIWPMMEKLPNEGVYSPTQLLKLIHLWSTEVKFFPLLNKKHSDGETTVLNLVFKLLLSRTAHPSVTSMIMDVVANLLTSGEDELPAKKSRLQMVDAPPGPGVEILISHVPQIIDYLHGVVRKMTAKRAKRFTLPVKDIKILGKLSCHVTDAQQCGEIISLLIPFLARDDAKDENMECDILVTIQHLLDKAENPADFLPHLARPCSSLSGRMSRRHLCDVIKAIAHRCPEWNKMAELVLKLNAWDRRRVDEVDYESRLDAYVEINAHVREMQHATDISDNDATFLSYVIHNASYFLRTSDDMSLRDSASNCLHQLVEKLGMMDLGHRAYQLVVTNVLLVQIRAGLKVTNENPRNEFIKILALCVHAFPNNKILAPLKHFMNQEDIEVDVFANITHIQMHRRTRAMRKIIQLLPTSGIQTECLALYVLPVVSHFVNEQYNKHPAVIEAAVDCLGAICAMLPWSKYSQILRSYLGQLTKSMTMQKVMVKVIVSVLDNFHFDICSVEASMESSKHFNEPKEKKDETGEAKEEEKKDETEEDNEKENCEEEDEGMEVDEEKGKDKLTPERAKQIYNELMKSVIPQLKSALAKKAKSDNEHKMAKSKYAEDEEILRVPIALALVKLLQQFSTSVLKVHLPGVLLKVCEFLRSRAKDIRDTARDTLTKILTSLGHTYFPFVVAELQGALKRGYQVHVLVYTVVSLLNSMKSILKTEMLDSSIPVVVQILNQELFGELAQEKEVDEITSKLHEAKAIKAYDGYEILATYVGKGMIGKLLLPLKEVLSTTNSHKTNKKIEEVLKRISAGLIENQDLEIEVVMIFIHGILNDSLPLLRTKKDEVKVELKPGQQPPSTYLLEKRAPRGGLKPKIDKKTNHNILIEFGLQLLNNLLKRSKLSVANDQHKQFLDPFVGPLTDALDSKHVRVIAWSIRCLTWVLNAELPSLRENVKRLTNRLFVLLKEYAASGAAQGDNQELVVACFKAMTVLVRDVTYHNITADQVRVLLLYVEEDIHDNNRQATAFTLLRAILIRKLMIPEMNDVMMKLCKLSVTSDSPQIRQKCRQVILKFLMDYPLGKKVKNYLEFFVAQLTYEMEPGRESVLELMIGMFSNFPTTMMEAHCLLFFMPLATRLINDESAKCRKCVSLALKSLLARVSLTKRDEIVSMVTTWSQDSKPLHQQLAMNLFGLLVEVEREKFERRIEAVLPIISDRIQPDRFSENMDEDTKSSMDKVLYTTLNCLVKILTNCPSVVRNKSSADTMNHIWSAVRGHLTYPHHWVRLAASQLFGLLFAAWSVDEITKPRKHKSVEFLEIDSENTMRQIALDMLKQLKDFIDNESGDQIVKNLVFVAKCAKVFQKNSVSESENEEKVKGLRLDWLIRKMSREATYEATQNVKCTLKRQNIYKWMAAVSADLGKDELPNFLYCILPPLVRDTSDMKPNLDEDLKTLANEVLDFVKNMAGVENFLQHYSKIQTVSGQRKEKRKREQAIQNVAHPEIASRKKIKKNLLKTSAKKRKIALMRPTKGGKKRKMNDLSVE